MPVEKTDSDIPVDVDLNSFQIEQNTFVIVSVVDVTERKRVESVQQLASEERVEWFERLVAELSATFINVPSEQVDGIIEDAQRRIVEALDLDRAALWVAKDGDLWYTHDWTTRLSDPFVVS